MFARGFRLHTRDGVPLDGAEFPSGQVVVLDDAEYLILTGAPSIAALLAGHPYSRVEWSDD
ncbi:hypothetical protein [Streptomyces niveus]|uniref:hypothetical protein n=1 Tax=Streptomyces niveus TaxID=193462 RepID=UPI0033B5437A